MSETSKPTFVLRDPVFQMLVLSWANGFCVGWALL